jgi:hypothetical protein
MYKYACCHNRWIPYLYQRRCTGVMLYPKFQHWTILFWNVLLSKGRRKEKKISSTKDFLFVFSSNIEWGGRKIDCVPVTGTLERPSLSCVWVLAKVRVESSDGFSKTDPEPNCTFRCMLQYSRIWRRGKKNWRCVPRKL